MRYRKKPVIIDAFRLGVSCAPEWFSEKVLSEDIVLIITSTGDVSRCSIKTLEGIMTAEAGDFIIKGVKGEIYPCKADIFYETYEPVED